MMTPKEIFEDSVRRCTGRELPIEVMLPIMLLGRIIGVGRQDPKAAIAIAEEFAAWVDAGGFDPPKAGA